MLPGNWPAVRLFAAVQSQWRHGPSGHPTGLDYAGCRAAAAGLGIGWRAEFDRVRIMEVAALEESDRRG